MINATEILSKFISKLKYEDLPPEVIAQTKLYIADYYASLCAGYKINEKFNKAIYEIISSDGGKPEASFPFSDKKLPVGNAAYMMAIYAHGADMDDGNRKAMGHVASHVMSTVFSLAQILNVKWEDVFTAINSGYEVYNRVAAAAQPDLVHRGFHSTGTAGAIACGAAAAKLMGLDEKGIYAAMSIAAVQSSGLIIIAESGQSCKPLNPANAARTGILSARLAEKQIKAPQNPLESKKGWFHAMADNIKENEITDGLGSNFTICDSYLKPYPSCRHTHCGIEAVAKIKNELDEDGLSIENISEIKLYIYRNAIQIAGQIKYPESCEDAKFSIHYALATALINGSFTLDDIKSDIPEKISTLIGKTELIADDSMEDTANGIRGARLCVIADNGKCYCETVLLPKGDRQNPFSFDDMRDKMSSCMKGLKTEKEITALADKIMALDLKSDYSPLM